MPECGPESSQMVFLPHLQTWGLYYRDCNQGDARPHSAKAPGSHSGKGKPGAGGYEGLTLTQDPTDHQQPRGGFQAIGGRRSPQEAILG